MPGSGKTTMGHALAAHYAVPFLDLDAEIVARAGQVIPAIFLEYGEVYFRQLEAEVLRAAASGSTNKEIAKVLDISPRTVQVHLANVFSKLGVGSRTEAVLFGIKRGWIDPSTVG